MKVAVAFDHRGVALRPRVIEELESLGHEVVDLGADAPTPRIDYPDKAREVGEALVRGEAERAVLVCSSGVGAAIAACKVDGVRAAVCHDVYTAHQGVEHDDMNVLCLGSEIVGGELAAELIRAFLAARFDGGERYVRRLEKVRALEEDGRFARARDISVLIRPGIPIYDGNAEVQLERDSSIADGAHANVSRLGLGVPPARTSTPRSTSSTELRAQSPSTSSRCSARPPSSTRHRSKATSTRAPWSGSSCPTT